MEVITKNLSKVIQISTISLLIMSQQLFANGKNQSSINKSNISDIQEFYYKKGYEDGQKDSYAKGYKDAIRDVLRVLSKYRNKMSAIEASKYLMRNGKITYPQVFKVEENGNFKIVIIPPKAEDTLTIEDLVKIPLLHKGSFTDNISFNNDTNKKGEVNSNAFHLQNEKYYTNTPLQRAKDINNEVCLLLPKNYQIKKILEASGKPFIEEQKYYKVFFNSITEKRSFCENIGVKQCD